MSDNRIIPSNIRQFPRKTNTDAPQPPDSPAPMRRTPVRVLDVTRDEMTRRWLSGVKLNSIHRRFTVSRAEAEEIVRSGVKIRVAELRRAA